MIKANELRIGNFVSIYNQIKKITGIAIINDIEHYLVNHTWIKFFDDLKPIPLTEEWLIKFGFEEYIDFGRKTCNFDKVPLCGFTYSINTNKVMIMHKGNNISHWLDIKIKYVHQLQNLYFLLTGEELEIKETTNN